MLDFTYYTPTKVHFGKDKHLEVGKIIKDYGFKTIMMQYGQSSIKKSGLYDEIMTSLSENGIKVIAVVLKCPEFNTLYKDTEKLLEFAYNNFEKVTVSASDVEPKEEKYTTYIPEGEVTFWVQKEEKDYLTYDYSEHGVNIVSPSGAVMGSLNVDVKAKYPWWKVSLYILLTIIVAFIAWLLFMYIVLIIKYNNKKRRRRALKRKYK